MKKILVILMLVVLSGCAAVLPKPDTASSIVYLSADNRNTLLAESIDGSTVYDGRYFKVSPGSHELEVLVMIENTEELTATHFVTFKFDGFQPEKSYRLVLTDNNISQDLRLLDENGSIVKKITM